MLIIFYLLKMIFTTGLISFRIVMYAFEYVFFFMLIICLNYLLKVIFST